VRLAVALHLDLNHRLGAELPKALAHLGVALRLGCLVEQPWQQAHWLLALA